MPLRDHFRPPLTNVASSEELHCGWPGTMAMRLNTLLPPEFRCGLKIHLGTRVEVNVGTLEFENGRDRDPEPGPDGSLQWEAPAPTLLLETDELTPPEYEVRVYDLSESRRLVAAVEIVSPRNKDRPSAREEFVSKCHAMLQQEVCVVIVDPVTIRGANLYAALAERIGAKRPAIADEEMYAVGMRLFHSGGRHRVQSWWEHALAVDASLPTLPLWISDTRYVALELETTYMDTCKGLRID